MESHEARPGMRVRVKEGYRRSEYAGMPGTIKQSYGPSVYEALDVQLEDGRSQVFWLHELEMVEKPWVRTAFYDGS
jgi:hypothetical protein